ncbi:hypothetical protein KFK09_007105 [Dendrobium nobile]|uniref:Reverse transcriptase domain-containing protein n=1 Tax=Dendrobium nobile TaxID=94219 RepID=A0A8T3BVJ6_DENNO|nr:hypothetical protein KFK09_007105 [Dendrobium nobile]
MLFRRSTVVFSGCSSSSPGTDGLYFEFYKKTWSVTGTSICNVVKSFFAKCYLPKSVKVTAISLIPKKSHVESIHDFRPIALCNIFYKIIKIIIDRMKPIMPIIVHQSQVAFIAKR